MQSVPELVMALAKMTADWACLVVELVVMLPLPLARLAEPVARPFEQQVSSVQPAAALLASQLVLMAEEAAFQAASSQLALALPQGLPLLPPSQQGLLELAF